MTTTGIPKSLLKWLTLLKSAVLVGATLYLMVDGRISTTDAAAVLGTLGGAWSGIAGVLVTAGRKAAATAPAGATTAPSAPAVPHLATTETTSTPAA